MQYNYVNIALFTLKIKILHSNIVPQAYYLSISLFRSVSDRVTVVKLAYRIGPFLNNNIKMYSS